MSIDPTKDYRSGADRGYQDRSSSAFNWQESAGPIFRYGLATGFALIMLGLTAWSLVLSNVLIAMLLVCVGLGIILGAFGSTATVTLLGQSVTLVGVAGIAMALFTVVLHEMDDRYVRVKIGGDVEGTTIELIGDRSYLGAFQQSEKTFDFIIFGKEIRRPVLSLHITFENKEPKTELIFACIKKDLVGPYLATGRTIEWEFSEKNATLLNIETKQPVADLGPCGRSIAIHDPTEKSFKHTSGLSVVSSVFAEVIQNSNADQVHELIQKLESNADYERRLARTQLADRGIEVVQPLVKRLHEKPLTYRTRLGVVVALTEMLRQNKVMRTEIIARINEQDLLPLLSAATYEDRTIRVYATEFLYDLGDPRAIPLALQEWEAASENGRYNLLFVIKGAVPFVSPRQQNDIAKRLGSLKSKTTPKTNDLIDSIIALTGKG